MRHKSYVARALLILASAVTFISLFSFGGVRAYEAIINTEKRLPNGTEISGVHVGEMTLADAESKVEAAVSNWKAQSGVALALFDERVILDSDAIRVELAETLENATSGGKVTLEAQVPEDVISSSLERFTYEGLSSQVGIGQLKQDVVGSIRLDQEGVQQVDVGRSFSSPDDFNRRTLNTVTISSGAVASYVRKWGEALDGHVIKATSDFSFITALEENDAVVFDDPGLDMMAAAVFQVLAESNFVLRERFIHERLPEYAEFGEDADVHPPSQDLRFFNPNIYDYELKVDFAGNELRVSLFGHPFMHEYQLLTKNREPIFPRTKVLFHPDRLPGDRQLLSAGSEGIYGEVVRQVRSGASILGEVKLGQDYYPPKHRVEEWSLQDRSLLEDDDIVEEGRNEEGNSSDRQKEGRSDSDEKDGEGNKNENEDINTPSDEAETGGSSSSQNDNSNGGEIPREDPSEPIKGYDF